MVILAQKQQRKQCLAKQREAMQITNMTAKLLQEHNDPSHYVTRELLSFDNKFKCLNSLISDHFPKYNFFFKYEKQSEFQI